MRNPGAGFRQSWRRFKEYVGKGRRRRYGWVFVAVLLGGLSIVPFLIPQFERMVGSARPQPSAVHRPPLVTRLLVIVVDGLGYRAAFRAGKMPRLLERARHSAWGVSLASFPTVTAPGIQAIFSGYRTPPRPGFPGGANPARVFDSVFARAAEAGLRVFIVGQQDYDSLFDRKGVEMSIVPYHAPPADYDERVLALALPVIKSRKWDFLALHLFDLDVIGHISRADSPEYMKKLAWLDKEIDELASLVGPETTVVVTSDHGQLPEGTHGGVEAEVRESAFLMWGPRALAGKIGSFSQVDIAPTLSALLGVAPPSMTSGSPVFKAIDVSLRERATIMEDLLEQHKRQWLASKVDWPWLRHNPDKFIKDASVRSKAGDYKGVILVAERATADMERALREFSPAQWFGKIVWMLYFMMLAAWMGAVYPSGPAEVGRIVLWVGAGCLLVITLPLLAVGLWPFASTLAMLSSGGLLALSALPGLAGEQVRGEDLLPWFLALLVMAIPTFLDANLWSFLVLITASVVWAVRREDTGLGLPWLLWAAVGLSMALRLFFPLAAGESLARAFLPEFTRMRKWGAPPMEAVAMLLVAALACLSYGRFSGMKSRKLKALAFTLSWTPLLASVFAPPSDLTGLAWTGAVGWISLGASCLLPVPPRARLTWLSLIGLAFCRTMIGDLEFCCLVLAVAAGWGLEGFRDREGSVWPGLAVLALFLWGYTLPGGRMNLSRISVAEAYIGLGFDWHPRGLVALMVFKHVVIAVLPVLPSLSLLGFEEVAAAGPFLGAFSASNVALLWVDRYFVGSKTSGLLDERAYEMTLWATALAWVLAGAWALSRRLLGPPRRRAAA